MECSLGVHSSPTKNKAENGHDEICQMLVTAGAQLNLVTSKGMYGGGWTPLHHAVMGHVEICQMLVTAGAQLNLASFERNSKEIREIVVLSIKNINTE